MPKLIPIKIAAAQPTGLDARLRIISTSLRALRTDKVKEHFELADDDRLLKTTISLCPVCLQHSHAAVFTANGKVYKATRCATDGISRALLENDQNFYYLSSKDMWGVAYATERTDILAPFEETSCCSGGQCGSSGDPLQQEADFTDQKHNKTCTVLVEITDACNLACRVCYADSKGDRLLPFSEFCAVIQGLIAIKAEVDSVQITGGEATLHPDYWRMLDYLYRLREIKKIYLPTNGIEFAKPGMAERLVPFRDKTLVLLQFDGEHAATNHALRNAAPQTLRQRLLKTLERHGIAMQLTMTLARDVSEQEIAWVVRQGIAHRNVRLVALLPTFYSGRYDLERDPLHRLTLSDAIKGVALGLTNSGQGAFQPIPCSHPNCGWAALFARRFGFFANISRFISVEAEKPRIAYKTILNKGEIRSIVSAKGQSIVLRLLTSIGRLLIRPQDVFGIVVKPFMDVYSYDQDRISSCCHHTVDPAGNLLSFCEYNALKRNADAWAHLPQLAGHKRPPAAAPLV